MPEKTGKNKAASGLTLKEQCSSGEVSAERKRMEAALRESEDKFSKAFQAVPALLSISSLADGRYIEVNEGFERTLGYRRDEVIGRTAPELGIWEDPHDRDRAGQPDRVPRQHVEPVH